MTLTEKMADLWMMANVYQLALMAWREARSESDTGIIAVMWTVRDRVEHPKWWGNSYSAVLAKKWQYSSMAAPGDSQLILWPVEPDRQFTKCLVLADGVIHGTIKNPFPGADSYYANYIEAPSWAKPELVVGMEGRHTFFNVDGSHPENDLVAA